MFPAYEIEEDGKEYQVDTACTQDFIIADERGLDLSKFPFTKEQFLENKPVVRSLEALGIDIENSGWRCSSSITWRRTRPSMWCCFPLHLSSNFRTLPDISIPIPMPRFEFGKDGNTAWPLTPRKRYGCWLSFWQKTLPSCLTVCQTTSISRWVISRSNSRIATRLPSSSSVSSRFWSISRKRTSGVPIRTKYPIIWCCWSLGSFICSDIQITRNSLIVTRI